MGCNGILYMKKLWGICRAFLRRRQDWCVFGITFVGMVCWSAWYLSPDETAPRFRLGWNFDPPDQPLTLSELRDYVGSATLRCDALKREVKVVRGISPGSPAEKQLEEMLAVTTWAADTESYIQHTFNLLPESPLHEEPRFRPLTDRQRRIIQFGDVIDAAFSLRSKEGMLTALVAQSAHPTKIEGFYTNYRELELVITRCAEGYQVRLGGCYGNSKRAYGYDFTARREGDTLIGKAGLMRGGEVPAEQDTLVIEFNRGIARVKSEGVLGQGNLVKLADLPVTGKPVGTDFALGAGACSRDDWEGRLKFLRNDVTWVSEARPSFYWDAWFVYSVGEEALGGPRADQ